MDNQRIFLWIGLAIIVWLTWRTWVEDYGLDPQAERPVAESPAEAVPDDRDLPQLDPDDLPEITEDEPEQTPRELAGELDATVRVVTDVLDVDIALTGGTLVRAELPQYPREKDRPDVPVRLLSPDEGDFYVLQSGLRRAGDGAEPTHLATFSAQRDEYRLEPGQDELTVELLWEDDSGLRAVKAYTFRRGWYAIDLEQRLYNDSDRIWAGAEYTQLRRRHSPPSRSLFSVESYSFSGPVLYDGNSYSKLNVGDLHSQPITQRLPNGWLAGIQHHFLAAAVPPPDVEFSYTASARDNVYLLSAVGPVTRIEPSSSHAFQTSLFVGPKLQNQLRAVGDGLELTVDYGIFTLLAQPLFWLIDRAHDLVGNWGWAIIIVTVLIKLVFWKLTAASGRSMAKMRRLQPRLKALQERYKDDRQALSRAMMDLYKKEKVNPAAGCLPILIQMPFFLAFYWVLLESVEMRQAPFMLWIDDLSSRDPWFILPLLMGAAMYLQTKLNPAPPDPVQAKVMQFLPIIFTVFFAFFPAGLVLYWFTNTVLSVFQQWRINRAMEVADKPAKA